MTDYEKQLLDNRLNRIEAALTLTISVLRDIQYDVKYESNTTCTQDLYDLQALSETLNGY